MEKSDSRLTSVIFAFLLIKSGLHFVLLQWTLVILIRAAGRLYNGTLVLRLLVLGIVPFGDNCTFRIEANEIHAHQRIKYSSKKFLACIQLQRKRFIVEIFIKSIVFLILHVILIVTQKYIDY